MKKLLLLLSVFFVVSCSPEPILYILTTSSNPAEAGTVIPATRQYNEGDTATLIATPAAEYVFDKWTGAEGGSETTIVMSSDKTVVANFIKKKYTLNISPINQKKLKKLKRLIKTIVLSKFYLMLILIKE